MKTLLGLGLFLIACGGATEEPNSAAADAGVEDDVTSTCPYNEGHVAPGEGPRQTLECHDPTWYACCHFADEGLDEYKACCEDWRAAGSPLK